MTFQSVLRNSFQRNDRSVAIVRGEQSVSYSELGSRADKITNFLLQRNLSKESILAVYGLDRMDHIQVMCGVMNAGCVIAPVSSSLPTKRLRALLEELSPKYIITSGKKNVDNLRALNIDALVFDLDEMEEVPEQTLPTFSEEDSLYIYFTSGTTGKPKGIVGRNGSLLQFLQWEINTFGIDGSYRFSQLVSPDFDAYLRDIFVPLLAGGTICLPPNDDDFFTSEKMTAWINENHINAIHCVPSVFRTFIPKAGIHTGLFSHLKYVFLSGERIRPSELAPWYKTIDSSTKLVNFYGATETTMIRMFYVIDPGDVNREGIPVGKPIADTEVFIGRDDMTPCDLMEPGDLYLISDFTTKGYLNDPGLTEKKFLSIIRNGKGTIAFDTGDRARMTAGGNVELLGRKDRQVKLRGIRIELDEIENILMRSGFIRQAAICFQPAQGAGEDDRLIAFISRNIETVGQLNFMEKVEVYMNEHLPEYMKPMLAEVDSIPLLANGKTDYRTLLSTLTPGDIIQPNDLVEFRLLAIWKSLLGDKPISVEENFTTAGGNSLAMIKLIGRIRKDFEVKLTLNQLFANLTIRKQVALIRQSEKGALFTISKAGRQQFYRATKAQERLYVLWELDRSGTAYNMPMAWTINGSYSVDHIADVLRKLLARHSALRSAFKVDNGTLVFSINESPAFDIEIVHSPDEDLHQGLKEFVRPFDLSNAPLLRCRIVKRNNGHDIIAIDMHHIIMDGHSQTILFEEFLKLYEGHDLAPLSFDYADYAVWEQKLVQSELYAANRNFWKESFNDQIPRLELPAYDRSASEELPGATEYFTIAKEDVTELLQYLQANGVTPFQGFFAAYFMLLWQYTGKNDIVIGIATNGRLNEELDHVVGLFTKTLPIHFEADTSRSVHELILSMQTLLTNAFGYQTYDLSHIISDINAGRVSKIDQLFDTMFAFQDLTKQVEVKSVFTPYSMENGFVKFPIYLVAEEADGRFSFRFEYSTRHFKKDDISFLIERFKEIARRIPEDRNTKLIDTMVPMEVVDEADISFNF